MSTRSGARALLALACIFLVLAIVTALPYSSAKTNDLGYYSLCPFAPWSTLALLLGGGLVWAIRAYLLSLKD